MNYSSTRFKIAGVLATALPLFFLSIGANAQTVQIGTDDGSGGNTFPLGTGSGLGSYGEYTGEYQEVVSSTLFTDPIIIDSIGFVSEPDSDLGNYSASFTLYLAPTAADPIAGLSPVFATNETSPLTQVFSGTVNGDLEGTGNPDFVIPITPFSYDPTTGQNLLLDFVVTGGSGPGTVYFSQAGTTGIVPTIGYSRVYNDSPGGKPGSNFPDASGLELFLNAPVPPGAVPEPSPVAVVVVGLLMVGGLLVYRKKRIA